MEQSSGSQKDYCTGKSNVNDCYINTLVQINPIGMQLLLTNKNITLGYLDNTISSVVWTIFNQLSVCEIQNKGQRPRFSIYIK
jgi:hypothetical protein